jgi:Lrp/AsnC family leucine-responsive transcriptional regulator
MEIERMKPARKKPVEQYLATVDYELDGFDWKILRALAANARATNVEIARRVGLSEAPCSRRIARLQDRGIIEGYGVRVNPGAIGIGMMAFITLTLDVVSAQSADRFADLVQESPYVLECYVVSGNQYALLHVAAPDMRTYSEFVLDRLRRIPGVKDINSNFVMRLIKSAGGLPDLAAAASVPE